MCTSELCFCISKGIVISKGMVKKTFFFFTFKGVEEKSYTFVCRKGEEGLKKLTRITLIDGSKKTFSIYV